MTSEDGEAVGDTGADGADGVETDGTDVDGAGTVANGATGANGTGGADGTGGVTTAVDDHGPDGSATSLASKPTLGDDAPLDGFAADVRRRRERGERGRSGDANGHRDGEGDRGGDAAAEFFESVEIDPVDADELWAEFLTDGEATDGSVTPGVDAGAAVGVDADVGAEADATGAEEHVVEKRSFCQRCPHFDSPPAATCGHETAEIVAVADFERFRVRGCPMVAEYGGEDGPGSIPRSDDP